ncbi:MAG TPA: hypothetical protein VM052_05805, partial [Candidatus Limnocylindrales bacterium]|nr:hypothetical protein [Candidatus Limnocylindrales bacterium]
ADWQKDYNTWAAGAVAGQYSYGRFNWQICGFAPKASAPPSTSPGAGSPGPAPSGATRTPVPTPVPTQPPKPTKKP